MAMNTESSQPLPSSSLIIWGHRTRSSARLREQRLPFEVLDNPSLREEILKHAIRGNDGKVDQRTASTLRLVQKSWDESILRILWKSNESLYKILPGNLTAAVTTFAAASSRIINGPPPPLLELEDFWQLYDRERIQTFSDFLTNCGPALLNLGIELYDLGVPWTSPVPQWPLSRLDKLKIILTLRSKSMIEQRRSDGRQILQAVRHRPDRISERLATSILRDATVLTELDLFFSQRTSGISEYEDATFFESLTLPASLVKISVGMEMGKGPSTAFLEALVRSPLSNLKSLSLSSQEATFASQQLFGVMDKFKACLKNLEIVEDFKGSLRNVGATRFPVMQQLEVLSITSITAELESGQDPLERRFPKLHTLRLRYHTLGMLRKWIESSIFTGVSSLELLLADENGLLGVNLETMRLVDLAFLNLRKLEVGISEREASGLKYVFMEMRQLEELKLKVFGDEDAMTTDVWESILTGVPPAEMIARARGQGPDVLENENVQENRVSINNLLELKSLSVTDNRNLHIRFVERRLDCELLISDFLFEHSLLQMPNLKHLQFEGLFRVSDEMAERWMRQDARRSLVANRFVDRLSFSLSKW